MVLRSYERSSFAFLRMQWFLAGAKWFCAIACAVVGVAHRMRQDKFKYKRYKTNC